MQETSPMGYEPMELSDALDIKETNHMVRITAIPTNIQPTRYNTGPDTSEAFKYSCILEPIKPGRVSTFFHWIGSHAFGNDNSKPWIVLPAVSGYNLRSEEGGLTYLLLERAIDDGKPVEVFGRISNVGKETTVQLLIDYVRFGAIIQGNGGRT